MRIILILTVSFFVLQSCINDNTYTGEIFDTHLHHYDSINFKQFKITHGAISGPWDSTDVYRRAADKGILFGLLFPCPNGLMPNGGPRCFSDGKEFPDVRWVEDQIKSGKINFLGELCNQYYGISPFDSLLFPYYELAQKYDLPIGVHLALAPPMTPYNCCPNFKASLGNPLLLEDVLLRYPKLRVWVMHAGHPYQQEMIALMMVYPQIYVDISAIASFAVPSKNYEQYLKTFIDVGLEDRIMFGSDSDISNSIKNTNDLKSLTLSQKKKIFYSNAMTFFKIK